VDSSGFKKTLSVDFHYNIILMGWARKAALFKELAEIISGKKVLLRSGPTVQFLILGFFTKPLTDSSILV